MRTTSRYQFKGDDTLYGVEYGTPAGQIQFVWVNDSWVTVIHTDHDGVVVVHDASNEKEAAQIANKIIKRY